MAPKKAPVKADEKKAEKPKKEPMSEEMKALKEKEKALEKIQQPDREKLDVDQGKIQDDITKIQDKLKKLNGNIADKSQGKEEHFKMRDEIRGKMDEYSARIDALEKQRSLLQGDVQKKRTEAREQQREFDQTKKKLGFSDPSEIDARIRQVEHEMQTESMTLKKEKDMMALIKELRAQKPKVAKLISKEGTVGKVDTGGMQMDIDKVKEELSEVREAKKLQQQAYSKLMEARNKVMVGVPELFEQREELNKQVREKYAQRSLLRDEFNALQRTYNNYSGEVRALRAERARLERNERQKQWEASNKGEVAVDGVADEAPVHFFAEIQYLENIKNYLNTLLPKKEEEAKVEVEAAIKGAAGETVLVAKGKREEEFFFAPTKKKNLKKGGAGKAKPLKHDIGTLSMFAEYKISAPTTTDLVPKALEDVAAKVAEFLVKREKKIEADKKKAADKAAGKEEEKEEAPADDAAA